MMVTMKKRRMRMRMRMMAVVVVRIHHSIHGNMWREYSYDIIPRAVVCFLGEE